MANYSRKTVAAEIKEQADLMKTSVENPDEKKTVKKRNTRKTTAVDSNVYIQYFGKQVTTKDIIDSCQADYKSNNRAAVKSLEVYVKPEDDTAYYVVNGNVQGNISL